MCKKSFIKYGLYLVLILQASFALAGNTAFNKLKQPFTAAEFALKDIDGKLHRLSDYRGKVIVLNFWATWCPPCREEMPSMERARKKLLKDDVVILAVNVGEDEDTIFNFTGDYPVEFPLLMDSKGEVIKNYPVMALPTTYIISPDGIVTHRTLGGREWDNDQILNELRAMQKKSPDKK